MWSRFTARSYEVDSYAHLNNGVYLNWLEQARLEFLQAHGFSYDGFAEREEWFVVARVEIDFRRPVVTGDAVELETRVERLGDSSVRFRQAMTRDGDDGPACEASTVMVFHGPDGRAVPIPGDFRAAVGG